MLKAMRLRDKMTLWYSALTLLVLAVFACAVYFLTDYVLEEMLEREVKLSMTQLIAQVENENGLLTFEDEVPIASDSMYFITEDDGSELTSFGSDITLFDSVPIVPNAFRFVQGQTERWLLLDSDLITVDHFTLRVRVASSCALGDRVLATLRLIFLIGVPIALLAAVLGGYLIAKRSLKPIGQIIRSAETIARGDLSARIPAAPAKDELGELTHTLNVMLTGVETAFKREQRFTSDASHELRTPVAVLRAYTEGMLAEDGVKEEQAASLQTMLTECSRMQKIIGQLLSITRGQEGRYPVCIEQIPLLPIIEGVDETLSPQLKERHMTLQWEVPPSLTLPADQSLLTELVMNLTENAVKYGKENGHIQVTAISKEKQVMLTVADDGIGIPKEALPYIFERFYRVDTARDRSGTGLGLSICDWIVKTHGGTITVSSTPGQGTVFTILLPLG